MAWFSLAKIAHKQVVRYTQIDKKTKMAMSDAQ